MIFVIAFRRLWKNNDSIYCIQYLPPPPEQESNGIYKGHAYSLLRLFSEGDLKLISLRNPWGKGEWRGDWSDRSPLWTKVNNDKNPNNSQSSGHFVLRRSNT